MGRFPATAVIPAWNARTTIERALDSLNAQTLRPEAVVVVDDGSSDDTAATAGRWASAHPDLPTTVLRQPNGGVASARNRGVGAARSEWIAFLDADDRWLPGKLAAQAQALADHPDLDLVATLRRGSQQPGRGGLRRVGLRSLLAVNTVLTSSVLLRRHAFDAVGGFVSGKRSEDYDLWLRLAADGFQLAILREEWVVYGEGKATIGVSGVSGAVWRQELGELDNFWRLWRSGRVGPATAAAAGVWSTLKFPRRLVLSQLARRRRG